MAWWCQGAHCVASAHGHQGHLDGVFLQLAPVGGDSCRRRDLLVVHSGLGWWLASGGDGRRRRTWRWRERRPKGMGGRAGHAECARAGEIGR